MRMLEMNNSQVGPGDIGLIHHTMTRLVMAKVLQSCNVDINDFIYFKESVIGYDYYIAENRIEDITDFLDYVNADYELETTDLTLHFPFPVEGILEDMQEAFEFFWPELEWVDFEFIEASNQSITFHLENYEGIPTRFFVLYYELMKEHIK